MRLAVRWAAGVRWLALQAKHLSNAAPAPGAHLTHLTEFCCCWLVELASNALFVPKLRMLFNDFAYIYIYIIYIYKFT